MADGWKEIKLDDDIDVKLWYTCLVKRRCIMDYQLFCEWLKEDKNMTERSARDVVSRCKRIQKITNTKDLNKCTESLLIECEDYSTYSSFIKSQLKRALALYYEFCKGRGANGK